MTERQLVAWLDRTMPPGPLLDELMAARRYLARTHLCGTAYSGDMNPQGLDEDGLRLAAAMRVEDAHEADVRGEGL